MTQVIPKIFAGLMMPFLTASSVLADTDPVTEALPLCGTAGHGHAYPGATVPFGMVQLSPDTPITGWGGCGGYYYTWGRMWLELRFSGFDIVLKLQFQNLSFGISSLLCQFVDTCFGGIIK